MKRHGPVRVARCGGRTTVELRSGARQSIASHERRGMGEERERRPHALRRPFRRACIDATIHLPGDEPSGTCIALHCTEGDGGMRGRAAVPAAGHERTDVFFFFLFCPGVVPSVRDRSMEMACGRVVLALIEPSGHTTCLHTVSASLSSLR